MLNSCAKICNLCTQMIKNVTFVCKNDEKCKKSTKTESTENPNFSKTPEKKSKFQNCSFPYVNTVNLNVN